MRTDRSKVASQPGNSGSSNPIGSRQEPLLKVDEVAARLNVSPLTVYGWVSSGRIAYCKLGRQLRFRREDVEELVKRVERRDLCD